MVLPIVLGGLIYLLFRTDSLLMFAWVEQLSLTTLIDRGRAAAAPLQIALQFGRFTTVAFPRKIRVKRAILYETR